MKKKTVIIILILIVAFLLFPVPMQLKDGGTVKYSAVLYSVSDVHQLPSTPDGSFREGVVIEVLGMEVFNNVK